MRNLITYEFGYLIGPKVISHESGNYICNGALWIFWYCVELGDETKGEMLVRPENTKKIHLYFRNLDLILRVMQIKKGKEYLIFLAWKTLYICKKLNKTESTYNKVSLS